MTDVILRNRDIDSGLPSPDRFGAPLVKGCIGFLAYATSANPTAEALSSTTDATAGHVFSENAIGGTTLSLTAGTILCPRDGNYEIVLNLATVSSASASGVMEFFLQKNAAALTNAKSTKLLQPAVAANFMSASVRTTVALVKGDLVRCVVTGTTGGVITIATGSLSITMLSDATVYTQV